MEPSPKVPGSWTNELKGWLSPGLFMSPVSAEAERDRGLQGLSAFICNFHEILYLALNSFRGLLRTRLCECKAK